MIDIIRKIESNKKIKGVHPTHATLREILEVAKAEDNPYSWVKEQLQHLQDENKIHIGNTINDQFIKIL